MDADRTTLAPVTMTSIAAAVRIGARHGFDTEDPSVLQETNNTVVWLRPHPVVAKVGTRAHSAGSLWREHAVAAVLAEQDGAPIAMPVPRVPPSRDEETGFVVTLWERLEVDRTHPLTPSDVGASLRRLHGSLSFYPGALPSFEVALDRARATLADDGSMEALPAGDRSMLRDEFDELRGRLEAHCFSRQALHGEAHDRNVLGTRSGPRWIDLEGVCAGPLEWDLAFLPDDAIDGFSRVDTELLDLLRHLRSACVATWCWALWEFTELRWHAEHHLEVVRGARE